jgi:hypothetical protein
LSTSRLKTRGNVLTRFLTRSLAVIHPKQGARFE